MDSSSHVGVMAVMSDPKAPYPHSLGIVGTTAHLLGSQHDTQTANQIVGREVQQLDWLRIFELSPFRTVVSANLSEGLANLVWGPFTLAIAHYTPTKNMLNGISTNKLKAAFAANMWYGMPRGHITVFTLNLPLR